MQQDRRDGRLTIDQIGQRHHVERDRKLVIELRGHPILADAGMVGLRKLQSAKGAEVALADEKLTKNRKFLGGVHDVVSS
jgi:hypothetical protein